MTEHKGKHRAEDKSDGKSTSETVEGFTRNDGSFSRHRSGRLGLNLGSRNRDGEGMDHSRDSE